MKVNVGVISPYKGQVRAIQERVGSLPSGQLLTLNVRSVDGFQGGEEDIIIISVDAVKDGMIAASEGKINFIVECNPLLGPQLMDMVQKLVDGEEIPKRVATEETTFTSEEAKEALPTRAY